MAHVIELNRHQREFLKKMREHPRGLPVSEFPSAVALRRWMRHPGFRRAIASIRIAIQLQSDLNLLTAAATASSGLVARLADGAHDADKLQIASLVQLVRVAHWRSKELRQSEMQQQLIDIKRPPEPMIIHPIHAANPARARELFRLLKEARAKGPDNPNAPKDTKPAAAQ